MRDPFDGTISRDIDCEQSKPMSSPSRQSLNQLIDVLEMNESFEEIDGCFKFAATLLVYRTNNEVHHAVLKARYSSPSDVIAEHLENDIRIPISAYCPPFSSRFTRAPDPLPKDSYIKKPSLISYDRIRQGPRPNSIAESVLIEADICELLMRYPHPNIVTYLGCQVSGSRITGLCFVKHQRTLMQEVNPSGLMKRQSRAARQTTKDYSCALAGIESGIRHLHSLGLAHNDINPANIMLDGDKAIIIDFGSCRAVGESLEGVGRTYEWYDEKLQRAVFENDLHDLEEIRIWLSDRSQAFQFDE